MTVYCDRNPELTRVDNVGAGAVVITSIDPRLGFDGGDPIAVTRPLGPGETVIFRSDSGATSGTVLTTEELYRDGTTAEGATITIDTGRKFSDRCG